MARPSSRAPTSKAPRRPRADGARQRRSLTHVGGRVETTGDPALAAILSEALDVSGTTTPEAEMIARAHVHGFHTYPARMHPLTARRLVSGLSSAGDVVLDPFSGSGTVVVEAALLGRTAVGTDLNPLAVRLARLKSTPHADLGELVHAAERVAAVAGDRRARKAGASQRYGKEDVALFDPHVLLELDGLRVGIDSLEDPALARDLELVLSSLLVKLSRRASDTSGANVPRRIAPGFPSRLFVRKTEELARSLAEIGPALRAAPPTRIAEDDAKTLSTIASGSVSLIVTSPPYPGVYDYLEHHALRLRWLRLAPDRFAHDEIGAARNLRGRPDAHGRRIWEDELGAVMSAFDRVLAPRGRAVLLIADSATGSTALWADEIVARLAEKRALTVLARASQERPHFHRDTQSAFRAKPRREHAILVGRRSTAR